LKNSEKAQMNRSIDHTGANSKSIKVNRYIGSNRAKGSMHHYVNIREKRDNSTNSFHDKCNIITFIYSYNWRKQYHEG
jgi:hypothetical protein